MAKTIYGVMDRLQNSMLYYYLLDNKGNRAATFSVPVAEDQCTIVDSALESLVVEITAASASKGKISKPRFVRFRTDKNVYECSINQIK